MDQGVSARESVTKNTLPVLLAERDMIEAISIVSAARMGEEAPYPIEPRHYRALAKIALEMAVFVDALDWAATKRELRRGMMTTTHS